MRLTEIDFPTALTRLLSQSDLRARFRLTPDVAMAEMNLRKEERAALLSLDLDDLDRQANSLIAKRFHEVRRLLPVTMGSLINDGRPQFFLYAAKRWPNGQKRHIDDAVAFCYFIERKCLGLVNRFERMWLEFILAEGRIQIRWVPDFTNRGRLWIAVVIMYRNRQGHCCFQAISLPRFSRFRPASLSTDRPFSRSRPARVIES